MDCFYINLDSATQRKSTIENNFAAVKKPDWQLTRFPAIDTEYVKANNIAGKASPAEKGCFLSHQILIGQNLADDKPLFIIEDDAALGLRTCALIDSILGRNKKMDWDLLFTDVCITELVTMLELLKYRRELAGKKVEVAFLDLSKIIFGGSTAYLVNGRSKQKVHGLLESTKEIDLPYDLHLRQLVHKGAIKAFSLFPFVTSLSGFSDASQIKSANSHSPDMAWNMFRKMVWIERDLPACKASLDVLRDRLCDDELNAFGTLFALMAAVP
jgi:GR25 family glycosyltransferase involved in LPS biosynthesis